MKSRIQFSTKIVNQVKNSITMKSAPFPKLALLIFGLVFISINACQRENIEISASEALAIEDNLSPYPITDIIKIDDSNVHPAARLPTRGGLPDIEDVPVVTSGSTINCQGTPEQCAEIYLQNLRFVNAIKPGQRLGVFGSLNLNAAPDVNNYNCYRYISNVGILDFCGYVGKDKDHPLNLDANGNYRIQLSPKNANRNLDLFVYEHKFVNGEIDTTLVAYSVLPAGETETVHLTKKGHYTIVVDEKNANSAGSDYVLSVSNNTPVKAVPILTASNNLNYQFKYAFNLKQGIKLIAWSFRKKINGNWTPVGNYTTNSTFKFGCGTCDYLVSPVYFNEYTGFVEEGDATLFRP
jgi:hypothetical protein